MSCVHFSKPVIFSSDHILFVYFLHFFFEENVSEQLLQGGLASILVFIIELKMKCFFIFLILRPGLKIGTLGRHTFIDT